MYIIRIELINFLSILCNRGAGREACSSYNIAVGNANADTVNSEVGVKFRVAMILM
ncbi:hypothetical protein D3C71_2068440 [compost metagenome]